MWIIKLGWNQKKSADFSKYTVYLCCPWYYHTSCIKKITMSTLKANFYIHVMCCLQKLQLNCMFATLSKSESWHLDSAWKKSAVNLIKPYGTNTQVKCYEKGLMLFLARKSNLLFIAAEKFQFYWLIVVWGSLLNVDSWAQGLCIGDVYKLLEKLVKLVLGLKSGFCMQVFALTSGLVHLVWILSAISWV